MPCRYTHPDCRGKEYSYSESEPSSANQHSVSVCSHTSRATACPKHPGNHVTATTTAAARFDNG